MSAKTDAAGCACHHVGLTMRAAVVRELPNAAGGTYWKATAPIGSIFGSEVEGQLEGIGATKEQALERLKIEISRLHESLWD